MPNRRRVAKARALADEWHGKGVVHTRRGVDRYGRVSFQGILAPKWFRIDWADGTSTEHTSHILRGLGVVSEDRLPPGVPPTEPLRAVMLARMAEEHLDVNAETDLSPVMQVLMPGLVWEDSRAVGVLWDDVQRALTKQQSHHVASELEWKGLCSVVNFYHVRTVVAPLTTDSAQLHYLYALNVLCHTNHPYTDTDVHSHYSPFCAFLYQVHDRAAGTDVYWLDVDNSVLDVTLPLAFKYTRKAVILRTTLTWILQPPPHRMMWLLNNVWKRDAVGLIIRVTDKGVGQPMVWLVVFKNLEARRQMLGTRVPERCSCVWWDSATPLLLRPGIELDNEGSDNDDA
jgi:hypothetical protein